MYCDATEAWRESFQTMGPWFSFLTDQFMRLTIPSNLTNPQSFCKSRDELRGLLSQLDPHAFSPPGLRHTSIFQIFEAFEKNTDRNFMLQQNFTCTGGCQMQEEILYLPNACNSGGWMNAARRTNFSCTLDSVYLQLFVDLQIAAKIQQRHKSCCNKCHRPCASTRIFLHNPSPWLFFLLPTNVRPHPQPSPTLEIGSGTDVTTYHLFGVVYYNGMHFTSVWMNKDASCWGHDGLAHNGRPERLHSADLTTLRNYAGCDPHLVLYSLDCSSTSQHMS